MSELGGVLTGPQIVKEVAEGNIEIDPWDPARLREGDEFPLPHAKMFRQVNPGSYDLRLGDEVSVYRDVTYFVKDGRAYWPDKDLRGDYGDVFDLGQAYADRYIYPDVTNYLDSRKKNDVFTFKMDPNRGWLLRPGVGYLMHTAERVLSKKFMPLIDGKSSMGRLFVTAHVTAGRGDVGFNGQYTLEVVALYPTIVYPGMRFCQMWFVTHVGDLLDYSATGHYVNEASMGPVPSMSWKQFEEDH